MIKQFWNPRSKKWVKIDCDKKGGIIAMQNKKWIGVPVSEKSKKPVSEISKKPAGKNGKKGGKSNNFFSRFGV